MFLYHLRRLDEIDGRDQMRAIVIAADDEDKARAYAALESGDEGKDLWFGPFVDCYEIGLAFVGDPGVIVADHVEG